eukprot:3007225-Prorocentrum_lima.AAC.1
MTSSLVGSEMCIRDRSKGMHAEPPTAPCTPQSPRAPRIAGAPSPPNTSCLLYTSDAADDM